MHALLTDGRISSSRPRVIILVQFGGPNPASFAACLSSITQLIVPLKLLLRLAAAHCGKPLAFRPAPTPSFFHEAQPHEKALIIRPERLSLSAMCCGGAARLCPGSGVSLLWDCTTTPRKYNRPRLRYRRLKEKHPFQNSKHPPDVRALGRH